MERTVFTTIGPCPIRKVCKARWIEAYNYVLGCPIESDRVMYKCAEAMADDNRTEKHSSVNQPLKVSELQIIK